MKRVLLSRNLLWSGCTPTAYSNLMGLSKAHSQKFALQTEEVTNILIGNFRGNSQKWRYSAS